MSLGNTDQVRVKILTLEGREFKAADLPKVKNLHAALQKMEKGGEIIVVGEDTSNGKPCRKYKAYKIKTDRLETAEEQEPVLDLFASWRPIFPDMFQLPEFTVLGVRTNHLEM